MSQPRHKLYRELAWLWPVMSPPQDYQPEAAAVHKLIRKHLPRQDKGSRPTLLELGSGGGHMLCHLREHYDATASDLSPAMLKLSRQLNPDVKHHKADMRTLRLRQAFDVVLIHDALGYMATLTDLKKAIRTASMHLKSGGVLVLLPDEMRETFTDHQAATDVRETEDGTQITLVSHAQAVDTRLKQYDLTMLFMIQKDGQLQVEEDTHRCGLFDQSQWESAIIAAGLEVIAITLKPRWRGAPCLLARKP
jgi:trans-aconitate methyltransferase